MRGLAAICYHWLGDREMAIASAPVLVLNQNYEPLNVCSVRRAFVLVDRGKAEVLENGRGHLHRPTAPYIIPPLLRLL